MTAPTVVHVVHSLQVGGTENGVVNLINAPRSEVAHALVTMTESGILAARLPREVGVHELRKRPGHDLRAFVRLVSLFRRLRPAIVHSRNWASFDAVLAARLARVPIVVHAEHGREVTDPDGRNARRNRLRRLVSPLVTRFVTVSEDLRRWLVQRVGIPGQKVTTVYNGVDVDRFVPVDDARARTALGLHPEAVVIGTVGRLDPVKDQAGLIRAFAALRAEHPRAFLIIAGEGPCRRELETLAMSLGLADRVRLLGERHDVPAVLQAMDVFVLPSIAEGISNTILEAMASGLPVVATDVGGNPELVEDGATGILVPRHDSRALARAIGAYLDDPEFRTVHGKSARQRVLERFSLGRMRLQYAQLYDDLLLQAGLRGA